MFILERSELQRSARLVSAVLTSSRATLASLVSWYGAAAAVIIVLTDVCLYELNCAQPPLSVSIPPSECLVWHIGMTLAIVVVIVTASICWRTLQALNSRGMRNGGE